MTSRRKPDACKTLAATASVWTDENTVGLDADFYRAGDGNDESFTAQMIVSAEDIAPDIAGIQNVWIQGVGCASAIATPMRVNEIDGAALVLLEVPQNSERATTIGGGETGASPPTVAA